MVAMLVATAMVLDFGIARLDRQKNKSVADTAVTAGMLGLDGGDGQVYSWKGVCQALGFLKANEPALATLSTPSQCSNPAALTTGCRWDTSSTHASYTGSANGIEVEISNPYNLVASDWAEESLATLQNDQQTAAQSCNHLAVVVRQTRHPGLGSLATTSDLTTSIRSVGRVTEATQGNTPVALLLLERTACDTILINGANSFVHVFANGVVPGLIHSDSDGTACSGNGRIFLGDHADGIKAFRSTAAPGIIRSVAVGTNDIRVADSLANVVAEGSSPTFGARVTRRPVDIRYIGAARGAVSEYEAEAATNGTGYTTRPCGATKDQLESVAGPLWISCTTGSGVFTPPANTTLQASRVFVDAKSLSSNNLSIPNADRVYIRGDVGSNHNGLSVQNTVFRMGQAGSGSCTSTATALSPRRARLVIGGGSIFSNSGGQVQLCNTTVVLRGGITGGCIPLSDGAAPSDTVTCNGRLNLGGPTSWTAPSMQRNEPPATQTDWDDFEDLALWTEANGSHDVGGGGAMALSGVFFLPNGEFKVHGGASQDVRNSQYIARKFRADGGSLLEMQPNPYDVIGLPILSAQLVR
jgi:hypothetical protein